MKYAYVIDEEPYFSNVMASTLRVIGFEVYQFYDATSAWNHALMNKEEACGALLFIDMALEPGSDGKLFSNQKTNNFITTGLVLADLFIQEKIIVPKKSKNTILYSAHYTKQLWADIKVFCQQHNVRSWQKQGDAELSEIVQLAESFIE